MGRNGEAPLPVLAASSPADCFAIVQEAWMLATRLMTPVVVLSDGFIANGAEPWAVPDVSRMNRFRSSIHKVLSRERPFCLTVAMSYWLVPGDPGTPV